MAKNWPVEIIWKISLRPYLEGFNDWVLMPTRFKVAFHWFIILVGSFIHDFLPLPQSYLSYKKNVFNVYFVKFGWGWTLLLLIPFISLTSSVYTSLNPSAMLRQLSRMAVATCGWYFWVNLFVYIEEKTGSCEGEETLISKRSCRQEGFHWNGVDISGHCFLLIYSALVISEELQPKLYWSSRIPAFEQTGPEDINGFQHNNIALVTPFVEVLSFFAGLLSILWEFMLVFTTVYFHTVYQKVLGAFIALFTWYITYRVWYLHEMSPGRPWVPKS